MSTAERKKLSRVAEKRQKVTRILRRMGVATDPVHRYEAEYEKDCKLGQLTGESCRFEGTHYQYRSPLHHRSVLRLVTHTASSDSRILIAGAGNGALLQELCAAGFKPRYMTGVDISQHACDRIREFRAQAMCGRIQEFVDVLGHFDIVFLEYFVDRDKDQRKTFETSIQLLEQGGAIALEGLFPCVTTDSQGVQYAEEKTVTVGKDAVEDIKLVTVEFTRLGVLLQKIIVGQRWVYSMDGMEILPSYILIFRKP